MEPVCAPNRALSGKCRCREPGSGRTYHFRLLAQTSRGTFRSEDAAFTHSGDRQAARRDRSRLAVAASEARSPAA